MQRHRMKIQDFWPGGHPLLNSSSSVADLTPSSSSQQRDNPEADCREAGEQRRPWVAFGKHLCGAATDFTLRCAQQSLAEALQHASGGSGSSGQQLRGLCVATCCHHRCTWQHLVGKPLFEELGFKPFEFELVSWMTGETRLPAECLKWSKYPTHHLSRHTVYFGHGAAVLQAGRCVATRHQRARPLTRAESRNTMLLALVRFCLAARCHTLRRSDLTQMTFQVLGN